MDKKVDFKREFSAGCLVFKKQDGLFLFLLGKHSGYHKWVLPKGLIEEGEKGWQTAIRETEEEVGVKARIVDQQPLHKVQYFFYADLKNSQDQSSNKSTKKKVDPKKDFSTRRVKKYQEKGGKKTRVFKTVSFYLTEFVSGSPADHGWEMEDAGWFKYDKALELMAFKSEKQVLQKAKKRIKELEQQPGLFS